ncbi:MAG: osmotically inducible protein OsmC, partial [Candidatus Aminicenantes bacterium]|nr:osmotically inducible protein OsmC [Candidatus Aminicenantes bacterium]
MSDRDIRVTFPGGLKVDAEYKSFVIHTDQPLYQGGEETAPAPFDLFLASIATCAGYYVLAFCRERGIPTDQAAVTMRTEKNPETKMIAKISIELRLPPGFPEKYKNAVIRAVDQCTVKAHMLKPPAFS